MFEAVEDLDERLEGNQADLYLKISKLDRFLPKMTKIEIRSTSISKSIEFYLEIRNPNKIDCLKLRKLSY